MGEDGKTVAKGGKATAPERVTAATKSKACAAIFFDIDGTLLVPGRDFNKEQKEREAAGGVLPKPATPRRRPEPSLAVRAAFDELHRRGHLAFICTGRPKGFLQQSLLDLQPDGFVCLAGAYVEVKGEVLRQERIPHDLLQAVAALALEAGLDVDYESDAGSVSIYPVHEPIWDDEPFGRSVETLMEYEKRLGGFSKFCLRGDQSERLAPVLPQLLERFDTADMGQGIREFTLKGMNKKTGIDLVLAHLNHGRELTFAFGDSENDLPMADAVETFVAMGNAFDHVKAEAAYVTDSVYDDGVATGLAHFDLI